MPVNKFGCVYNLLQAIDLTFAVQISLSLFALFLVISIFSKISGTMNIDLVIKMLKYFILQFLYFAAP